MYSLNRVNIIGYQTQSIEVRKTPGGTSVADLNLVVPYTFSAPDGAKLTGKAFHTVTVWGGMADVAQQWVKPGAQIFVAGRLQTDSWEDATTKEKKSKTKIVALEMILLDPKDGQLPPPEGAKHLTAALNRAEVIGNVTRDPEIRTTATGQKVLSLGVATNERWKDKAGSEQERTEFHNVVVWGDLADEVASSVKKGRRVFVSGRVQTRAWETQAGQKRTTTEIVADTVNLLGLKSAVAEESVEMSAKRREQGGPRPSSEDAPPSAVAGIPEIKYTSEVKVEDLPF